MKSRDGRLRTTVIGLACGAEVPSRTSTITAATAAAGAKVCITMHNWQ